jgi:predicted MFS family arabinose efflux permease
LGGSSPSPLSIHEIHPDRARFLYFIAFEATLDETIIATEPSSVTAGDHKSDTNSNSVPLCPNRIILQKETLGGARLAMTNSLPLATGLLQIPMVKASTADNESQLWVMAAIAFAVYYSNYMFPPLIPALSREFSVTPYQLGWLIPGFLIPYGISTLIYGALSDRWGRTPVLVALLCFATMTMVMVSLAGSWRTLLIARILSGLGCGGIVTIALAAVGDRYPYEVQGRPMGRMFGAIAAGIGFGSTLGPVLNPLVGWRNEFRGLACVCCLAVLFILKRGKSGIKVTGRLSSFDMVVREYLVVLETRRGGRTMAFIFCNGAFHGGIFAWLSVLLMNRYHLHDTGIGLALAGYGLPGILFGTVIGKWGDRYGRSYVVPSGMLWAAGCAFLLIPSSPRFVAALVVTALSAGFDATHPLMSSITTSLDPKHRGQITGLATFTNFVGMGIGALCFQQLIAFGFTTAVAIFASAQSLLGVAALYGFRGERPGCLGFAKAARA